jgi:2-hydroxy-3-oxopropionate reductase
MIIAFLGLGLMGLPMATHLAKAGYCLQLYNRSIEKAAPLLPLGAKAYQRPSEAVKNADIIISMLENEQIQELVLINQQTLLHCKPNALLIDMGSISPETAKQHAQVANKFQLRYIDAPVSGGTRGAEQAQLVIMAGANKEDLKTAQPVLSQLSSQIVHIGPVGSGQIAKCANQAIVGITISAVSEALLLAKQAGADPYAVREALLGGFAQSKVLDQHGERMLARNFEPGGTAKIQHKDLSNILRCAESNNVTMPLTNSVTAQYQQLLDMGHQDLDHSALLLQLEDINQTLLTLPNDEGADKNAL